MTEAIKGLTEGRIVHYVMRNGVHRAAVVVKVWNMYDGTSNLQVFLDGPNDFLGHTNTDSFLTEEDVNKGLYWATSVKYSDGKEPDTWHWIEPA